jgi:hypothetical protein
MVAAARSGVDVLVDEGPGVLTRDAAVETLVAFPDRTATGGAAGDVASDQSRSRPS